MADDDADLARDTGETGPRDEADPDPGETSPPDINAPDTTAPADSPEEAELEEAEPKWDPGAGAAAGRVPLQAAIAAGVAVVLVLSALVGWLGYRTYDAHRAAAERQILMDGARRSAEALTTVDWERVDDDVQRILDTTTGPLYDNMQRRVESFSEVVRQAKSKSVGSINEVALESTEGDEAKVLVSVTVNASHTGAPEQQPQLLRMRLTMYRDGDEAKAAQLEYVS